MVQLRSGNILITFLDGILTVNMNDVDLQKFNIPNLSVFSLMKNNSKEMFILYGTNDGDINSININDFSVKYLTSIHQNKVMTIIPLPNSTSHFVAMDNKNTLIVYNRIYDKVVIHATALPLKITTVYYIDNFNWIIIVYEDDRSFVWSLETGNLLEVFTYQFKPAVHSFKVYPIQNQNKQ